MKPPLESILSFPLGLAVRTVARMGRMRIPTQRPVLEDLLAAGRTENKFTNHIVTGRGDWAIAMYIQACEIDDPRAADALMSEILQYNQEDLDATWAVYRWLQKRWREIGELR